MQTLISAPPRTGKSLYCMSLIDQLSRKHPNRRIYTNIIGMNYPGVLTINSTPEKPFDWRDLPDGSIIFFDEAHEHPAFSAQDLLGTARTDAEKKRKAEILDIGDSLTLHGHFGFDIYLITQNPKLLREQVRAACSVHYVMRRLWGLDVAMIYEFAEVQTYFANATRKQALSVKRFRYPKNLYKYYVSSNVHNIQKRVPMLYMLFFAIPIAIFALGYSKASQTGFFGLFPKDEVVQEKSIEQPEYEVINVSDPTKTEEQLLLQAKENFNPDIECRKAMNLNLPECISWFDQLTKQQSSVLPDGQVFQAVVYNPDKPYDFEYKPQIQPQDFPRMSGVMTLANGRLMAIDQQGNYMSNVSQEDCRKWLAGYRPFNYAKAPQQQNQYAYSQPEQRERSAPEQPQLNTETSSL
ncbi:Zonular occludens toxin (Zot) [Acinetobacter junii]|uniref:zonular occludens toxin domain-containing protein n=1 Tax=Acinetobacter junii TaxID=40215 RepID=UPI001959904D|nr:zonular occludens toxin domain-containing protein [Acinetobacter junii]VTX93957.1 Zonular occludens toxin (Zot) [Acinetobacter junii]